jgi:hypothetical protein
MMDEPQVLRPFNRAEVCSPKEAADKAGKAERTIRDWCACLDIGRRVCGRWAVSKIALAMHLDGNKDALNAYLNGDRTSSLVTEYFERCGVPLPQFRVAKTSAPRSLVIGTKTSFAQGPSDG